MKQSKGKRVGSRGTSGVDTEQWRQRTAFVGFDWTGDHHDVVLVDQHGKIVEDFRFDDTAEGWQLLVKKLNKHPDPTVAIETRSGMTVQRLLEAGYAVYPVNPKAAKRYRERKAPSGTRSQKKEEITLPRLRTPWVSRLSVCASHDTRRSTTPRVCRNPSRHAAHDPATRRRKPMPLQTPDRIG